MTSPQPARDVLDASALLAYLQREPGADVVEAALSNAVVASVNWSEVAQKSIAHGKPDVVLLRHDLEALGLVVVPFGTEDAERAAQLWQEGRRLGLSLADRACLALAQRLGATVLTADQVWSQLQIGVQIRPIR